MPGTGVPVTSSPIERRQEQRAFVHIEQVSAAHVACVIPPCNTVFRERIV